MGHSYVLHPYQRVYQCVLTAFSSRMVVQGDKCRVIRPTLCNTECIGNCWDSSQARFFRTVDHGTIRFVYACVYMDFPNLVQSLLVFTRLHCFWHRHIMLNYAWSSLLHIALSSYLFYKSTYPRFYILLMGGMVMPQIAFGSLGHSFCSFQASSHQAGANRLLG